MDKFQEMMGMLNKWLDFKHLFNKRAGKWRKRNDFQPEILHTRNDSSSDFVIDKNHRILRDIRYRSSRIIIAV